MKALYFNDFGDNSVLRYGNIDSPQINADQLLVKTKYIGLNFADIYRRRGTYHIEKHQPYINGYEGLGEVVAVGNHVNTFKLGDKVFFVDVPFANAEYVSVPTENAINVPTNLDYKIIAAVGLQGLTADFLAHDLGKNKPGNNVFIHGISGGVGQILSQMLTSDGMNVYGTTSTPAKQSLALQQGAKKVFLRTAPWDQDYYGKFDTIYDGIGKTLEQSLSLVINKGKVIFYGMSGGNPPKIDPVKLLTQSKSLLTGDLWDYLSNASERENRSQRLFKYLKEGKIKISDPTTFPLSEGQKAYEYLESGKSTGKILLVP
ncbi:zinc-binding dehydrogenase [Liquorilactobacillus mali]|uniref:Oxidoreductase n=2 Tax=Liquorilactobacillus mali TaxID=1618 RepID=A0A0R2EBI7_9LACO|nr:zinc-binding dehydrogenase [Liquorilactobacillus mali]KRN09756.1 oxidoreductase [Liquorilactobacillus mali KCTC 3596 = DSM 20444]MDC7953344.1 zinc-binding dehydrogenase [Liquorilactobacillus mali]QFQ75469.1 zinc-binding dehydrogenase [Liquorilactobacillus mali]